MRSTRVVPASSWRLMFMVCASALLGCDAAADSSLSLPIGTDDPAALVAPSTDCAARTEALSGVAERLAAEADARWERVPFDAAEAVRSIRAGREASACFERAGTRDGRRAAAAKVLVRERELLRMVQQARRAYVRARAAQQVEQALATGERLHALLEPDNESTNPLRVAVERWLRHERARPTPKKEKS